MKLSKHTGVILVVAIPCFIRPLYLKRDPKLEASYKPKAQPVT